MKRLNLILTLCSLWVIPVAVFAQEATTGSVRGHVIDASTTQLPIEGVRVVIVSVDGLENEAETDSNGEYEIIGLVPGRYLMSVYKKGYRGRRGKPVTVIAGGTHYVPMKIAEYATTGTVRGHVDTPTALQLPIEGVRVVIVGVDGLENEAETDSNGKFELAGLAPGRYLVSIYKEGYRDRVGKPVTVIAGGNHYIPLKMTKKETFITFLKKQFGDDDDAPPEMTENETPKSQKKKFSFLPWLLLLCLAVVVGFIIGRQTGRRSD